MTKDELMALADAYAYQKALINVSQMLHSQILETDEARAALEAALEEVVRDAERYHWIRLTSKGTDFVVEELQDTPPSTWNEAIDNEMAKETK